MPIKKILFVNAYSARNLGDYSIILGMRAVLSQVFDKINITVSSSYHDSNQHIYPEEFISVDALWNISKGGFIARYVNGLYLFLLVLLYPGSKKFLVYRQADIICSVGGGYLYSSVKGPLGIGLLNMLFHIWLGIRFNKKVICFPQSVGPVYSHIDAWILNKILSKVDLFIAREGVTFNFLKNELGLSNVVESLDVAFALKPSTSYLEKSLYSQYDKVIGITVLDWCFAIKGSNKKDISEYLETIANALLSLSKSQKIKVIIFPQVTVSKGDSDTEVSEKLLSFLGEEIAELFKLPRELDPQRLMATYGDVDLFIGSRMHSTIFALASGCATLGLAYQPKTTATFKLLGLEKNILPVNDFSVNDLLNLIQGVKFNGMVTDTIAAYNESLVKVLAKNFS